MDHRQHRTAETRTTPETAPREPSRDRPTTPRPRSSGCHENETASGNTKTGEAARPNPEPKRGRPQDEEHEPTTKTVSSASAEEGQVEPTRRERAVTKGTVKMESMASWITRSSSEWAKHTGRPERQCPIGHTSYPVMGATDASGRRIDVAHTCVAVELHPEGRAVPLYGPTRIIAAEATVNRKPATGEAESGPPSGPVETAAILAALKPDVWVTSDALRETLRIGCDPYEADALFDQMLWLAANDQVLKRSRVTRPDGGESGRGLYEFKLHSGPE